MTKENLVQKIIRIENEEGLTGLLRKGYIKATEKPLSLSRKYLAEKMLINPPIENGCIEITNACNLHCKMCTSEKERQAGKPIKFIKPSLFYSLIDQLARYKTSLSFGSNGECLLHQDFPQLLTYAAKAREKGLGQIGWFDNGMLFNEKIARQVTDLKVDFIIFSVDRLGHANDFWRVGSNSDIVEANIKQLVDIRGEQRKPEIRINKIDIDSNTKTWQFIKYWTKIVDSVDVSPLHNPSFYIQQIEKYYSAAPHHNLKHCFYPFSYIAIQADGKVVACPCDCETRNLIGNVATNSVKKVWEAEPYRDFRRKTLQHSFPKDSACYSCNAWKTRFKTSTNNLSVEIKASYGETKSYYRNHTGIN